MPHNFTPEQSKAATERREELALKSKKRGVEAAKRAREGRKQSMSAENRDATAPVATANTSGTPKTPRPKIDHLMVENAQLRVYFTFLKQLIMIFKERIAELEAELSLSRAENEVLRSRIVDNFGQALKADEPSTSSKSFRILAPTKGSVLKPMSQISRQTLHKRAQHTATQILDYKGIYFKNTYYSEAEIMSPRRCTCCVHICPFLPGPEGGLRP